MIQWTQKSEITRIEDESKQSEKICFSPQKTFNIAVSEFHINDAYYCFVTDEGEQEKLQSKLEMFSEKLWNIYLTSEPKGKAR